MDLKSNEPFWLIKNGLLATYPSLQDDLACDVLVVGGGITGTLIAHQCIQDGYNTLLIDKREICNGSTSATTSMLQYEIDMPLHELSELIGKDGAVASYRACCKAIDDLGRIAKKIKSDAGFRQKNSLYYAAWKKDVSKLKKEFEARKDAGFKVEWMEAEDILRQYNIAGAHGGILSREGGSVDAFRLAHEVLQYNVRKGLQVYDKTELTKVEYKRGFNVCTTATGATIKARRIVYCIGYEVANLVPENFVKLLSTFAIVSEVNEEMYRQYNDILIWNTAAPYLYMRTTDDGRFLIGGEDEEFQDPVRRDVLIGTKEQKLLHAFHRIFPKKDFCLDFAWAGTFGETRDGLPYIGEHRDFKNSYFVCGFGGNGITFSVTGMGMVSKWLQGKEHPLSMYFKFGR